MTEIGEKCGVVAIYSQKSADVAPLIMRGLEALQHRGQESWGIALPGRDPFVQMGLIAGATPSIMEDAIRDGHSGIGHVRYSTKGSSNLANAQPFQIGHSFSIGHNGNIVNTLELAERLKEEFNVPESSSDSLLMGLRLLQILRDVDEDWFEAFSRLSREVVGSYTLTLLSRKGEAFAVRDPMGFRPLCIGWHEESGSYVAASESCALMALGARLLRDVAPGEIVRLDQNGMESYQFAKSERTAHCAFEYTYFAHPSSVIEGISVYEVRKRIGRLLGRRVPNNGDIVIPVPDSARPAALGYSHATGTPLEEGLIKDRYRRKGSLRSFIEPSQESREDIVKQIIPIDATVRGKDVVVVDDSIVRGTSSKIIGEALKKAGARKVKMVITFPPIRYPCYMGIDFPTQEELLAYRASGESGDVKEIEEKVAPEISVDEIRYNDLEGLAEGIGMPLGRLCTACASGDYSPIGGRPRFRSRSELKPSE